jgi:hypothetical protein
MKQIELTSKLVLAIIALSSVSAILVPTYAAPAIRSADIVNGEVKTEDLANGAVTTAKISDTNGVRSIDIVNGEVKTEDLASGAVQLEVIQRPGPRVSGDPGELLETFATCNDGEILIGGGFARSGGFVNAQSSFMNGDPEAGPVPSWRVQGVVDQSSAALTPFAECATITP